MAAVLIAKFVGDVDELRDAYDRAHDEMRSLLESTGFPTRRRYDAGGPRGLIAT